MTPPEVGSASGARPAGPELSRGRDLPGWVDPAWMRRALELAERGWGRVAPNPLVGAVLVHDGEVVGEGFHGEWGREHAEAVALRRAGDRAAGATLYVTLEPCAHQGKTPPCTEAILGARVRRVAIGCRDPHAHAAGGATRLRRAGVEVATGVKGRSAALLNAPFLWHELTGRPFVALKLGLSLDGRIAARPGARTPVTGERAWRAVHRWRAGFDAVLVGIGTAEADDPRLTARGLPEPRVPPVRIVLDPELRLSPDAALALTALEVPTWVVGGPGADAARRSNLEARGVSVLAVPAEGDGGGKGAAGAGGPTRGAPRLDLGSALHAMRARGIRSLLVEGGARIGSAFLAAGLVQRLYLVAAPRFLGPDGLAAFDAVPASVPREWRIGERRALGEDTLLRLENRELLRRLAEVVS
ncbi:MAG: bifunctional diaminohydroxyphosphoribosylaminopyrimidine deaminase/5-amino-6-(5-phosphoribosylamino)uracil reductase RibD [Gemmatimonadota bacterium]